MTNKSKRIRTLERRGLVGCSNNLKWDDLLTRLRSFDHTILSSVKSIYCEQSKYDKWGVPVANYFENFSYGPIPYSEIEWLDLKMCVSVERGRLLDPIVRDYSVEILEVVKNIGLMYEEKGNIIRIWGYKC